MVIIQSKLFVYNHWTVKRTHSVLVPIRAVNFPVQCIWSQFLSRMYSPLKIAPKIKSCRYKLIFLLKICIWCPYGDSRENCLNEAILTGVPILENTLVQCSPILINRLTNTHFHKYHCTRNVNRHETWRV